ncbi:MAG: radical SAM protein [Candidatus Omnitrophica bacterium]|nr:radical SAM protein [Candidatus Omnitrophota bacterium]
MKNYRYPSRTIPWGISRTIGNTLDADNKSLVKYVEFNITGRCQAGCITCPSLQVYPDEKISKSSIDLIREFKLFQSFFRKLKKIGMEFVTIYGREPTLWDREADEPNKFLKNIISWLSKDLKVRVCLATSGISLEKSVLKVLFDNQGVLFMKDWGSKESVEKLIKNKGAYSKIRKSWDMVKHLSKDYKKVRVVAEFLYTGINRGDLAEFWKSCLKNGFLPFVEVPIIKGSCVRNYQQLKITPQKFVEDIYKLSLLNLSLLYGLSKKQTRDSDLWQPPYGSVFPSPCDKLTYAKGVFLERNGNLSVCCGVDKHLGNIKDKNIKRKLRSNLLLKRIRQAYKNLKGFCADCDYSRKFHLCYGCRGNAYTYQSSGQGVFGQDPMCFGKIAKELGEKGQLKKIMSQNHMKKVLRYFKN